MKYTNQDWQIIIQRANQGTNELMTPEIIKSIDFMIKVNQKVAQSVGQTYLAYLQQIFTDLIKIYKLYSECISNLVNNGNGQDFMIKPMKAVRRDILRLIQIYIEKEENFEFFNQHFLPSLQTMVQDYQ